MADWKVSPDADLSAQPDAMRPPRQDAIEVVLTLSAVEYEQAGEDLAKARERLDLPAWASNTDVILASLRRVARE